MSDEWRNELATEKQKEKLRFFGCTWDDGITAGQASDALEECAKQFPDAEADYQKNQPATEMQKEKLRFFGCTWNGDITVGKASEALVECASQFPDREAMWQLQKRKWVKIPGTFPVEEFDQLDKTPSQEVTIQKTETVGSEPNEKREVLFSGTAEQTPLAYDEARVMTQEGWNNWIALHGSYGTEPGHKLTYGEARGLSEQAWIEWRIQHGRLSPRENIERQIPPEKPLEADATIQKAATDAPQLEMRREGFFCGEIPFATNIGQPDRTTVDQDWRNAPATEKQKEKLRAFGCKFDEDITVGIAKLAIECYQNSKSASPVAPEKSEVGSSPSVIEWDKWFKERRNQSGKTSSEEVTIQEAAKPQNKSPREIIPEAPDHLRQFYEMYCPACNGQIQVLQGTVGKKRTCPHCQSEITPVFTKISPQRNVIPAREVQEYARQKAQDNFKVNKPAYSTVEECSHGRYATPYRPTIQKPVTYISNIPIERFTKWLDIVLERNNKCLGGHWLPVGHVFYPFREYTTLTKGLCCQIADAIESRGYCVEPDARFGSSKYEKLDTLALFKSFDGDPIHPSTAYLGAANLLRLCILITTADGQIDLVELEVFRQAIENLPGLSLTDHKRLLILEQLLVQELSSASKTAAKIARAVPADKRLVIGKLLVEVAAANNFITDGERRVLEDIFKLLKIRHETLEKLINEICPWPRRDAVQNDVSEGDRQLWNQWRIDHPGVVIDDSTLTEMKWNFNDWKALNARWRDLHGKLAARKEQSRTAPEASSQKVSVLETFLAAGRRLGIRGKKIPEPIAMPAPKGFALDPDKIYAIQNDTKEVTAILSIVMEDEPEKSVAPAATITLPTPEMPKVSGDGNVAPQPTRFNGLDAAFHPILERLLARDSWPQKDFKSLADEFHFMPLNIRDTLNEWADEALGDFILDGEDPVVIRRELITKEKVYG